MKTVAYSATLIDEALLVWAQFLEPTLRQGQKAVLSESPDLVKPQRLTFHPLRHRLNIDILGTSTNR